MDRISDDIIRRLEYLETANLTGVCAEVGDMDVIDLVPPGEIERHDLSDLMAKTELYFNRRIHALILSAEKFEYIADGDGQTTIRSSRCEQWFGFVVDTYETGNQPARFG